MIRKTVPDSGTAVADFVFRKSLQILKDLANQMHIKHKGRGGADTDLFTLVTRDKTQGTGAVHVCGGDRINILGGKMRNMVVDR